MTRHFFITVFILTSFIPSLQAKIKFSSRYIDVSSDCTCLERNLQEGQDCTQFKCKDMAGYQTQTAFNGSACDLGILKIVKGTRTSLSINEVPSKIEWRFADNEPFAVIYRLKGPSENCADQLGLTSKKEKLVISGLEKYSTISGQINAKTKNANEKAREIADQGFSATAKDRD